MITENQKESFIQNLLAGQMLMKSCELAGFSHETYYAWKRSDKPEDIELMKRIAEAYEARTQIVADKLYMNATCANKSSEHGDVAAQKYWLNNRASKYWADKKKVETTGTLDVSGSVDVTEKLSEVRAERDRLEKIMDDFEDCE